MNSFNRIRDVILALLGLILGAPLFLLIAVAVWIESPGPVIFRQQRLGKGGKLFTMYKFRKFSHAPVTRGGGVTLGSDPRMTKVGAFLERMKFDELPQLWNILMGDMAIVGPRPESIDFQSLFIGHYAELLQYQPGLFGPNQVACRNEWELYPPDVDPDAYYREVIFPRKGDRDLEYMVGATFWSDLVLIAKGVVVSASGFINWRRLIVDHGQMLLVDLIAAAIAWGAANLVRFGGIPPEADREAFINGFLVLPAMTVFIMFLGGAYRHLPRYFSVDDAVTLVRVSAFGWFMAGIALIGLWSRGTSLLAFMLSWLFFVPLLFLPRMTARYRWAQHHERERGGSRRAILIYGAGSMGISLAHYLMLKEGGGCRLLGFMDDDKRLKGRDIFGFRVLGGQTDLAAFHTVRNVSEVWLTCNMGQRRRESLMAQCRRLAIPLVMLCDQYPFQELRSQPDSVTADELVGGFCDSKESIAS